MSFDKFSRPGIRGRSGSSCIRTAELPGQAAVPASNLPFNEWTEASGSERLTGALLERLTHDLHILEMNGESFRLKDSKQKRPIKPRS
jgi:IstB-like ATP binding protein